MKRTTWTTWKWSQQQNRWWWEWDRPSGKNVQLLQHKCTNLTLRSTRGSYKYTQYVPWTFWNLHSRHSFFLCLYLGHGKELLIVMFVCTESMNEDTGKYREMQLTIFSGSRAISVTDANQGFYSTIWQISVQFRWVIVSRWIIMLMEI